jgi:hypothetical protein
VSGADAGYPYAGGSSGVWGYESRFGATLGTLKDPGVYKDLMGYCHPKWISDYHFKKALAFRTRAEPAFGPPGPARPVLLLWGSAGDGEMLIEPAFVLDAPVRLPREDGPYRLEGHDAEGTVLFSLSFAPRPVARGGGHFAFAVPVGPDDIEALDVITLTGPEGRVTMDRAASRPAMALATDATTGRVRAILRDGVVPADVAAGANVVRSRGLPGRGTGERRE